MNARRTRLIGYLCALGAGTLTLVAWWLLGDREGALVRTATVLVIASRAVALLLRGEPDELALPR